MTLDPPDIDARVRASFAKQSMMHPWKPKSPRSTQGIVPFARRSPPGARQQQGFGHAGLTFSIGDSAAGYAALTCMGGPDSEVVTSEIKINLLAPPANGGDFLLAEGGRVIRPGRRLITVQSDVWAVTGGGARKHVAVLLGTMVPVPLTAPGPLP